MDPHDSLAPLGSTVDHESGEEKPPEPSPEERELEARMGRFHDLPIVLSVQLDRKRVRMREILDLAPESVVRMARSAGENVDLLMDGVVVGNGEIVVIDDTVGLRVTDLRIPNADVGAQEVKVETAN